MSPAVLKQPQGVDIGKHISLFFVVKKMREITVLYLSEIELSKRNKDLLIFIKNPYIPDY